MQHLCIRFVRTWVFVLLAGLLLSPASAYAQQDESKAVVKVMTYNVNEGTDFLEVLSATTPDDFYKAVQITLKNIDSTNPPLRMQAIAREIAETEPQLVGLQEVTTWTVGGQVRYDMLDELITALHNLGEEYTAVVVVDEFQIAGFLPDKQTLVEGLNHDVILARSGSDMEISNLQQGHFSVLLPVPLPVEPFYFQILRGWGSADVSLHGQSFRFVVSHLEQFIAAQPLTLLIQEAQAAELVLGPGTAPVPVIMAVDTNADALGNDLSIATYQLIGSFGFTDAWGSVHPDQPGATWGFMPDPADPRPIIYQRIDYVFFNGGVRALNAQRAGILEEEQVDGLWPSDHAGVRATLLVGWD